MTGSFSEASWARQTCLDTQRPRSESRSSPRKRVTGRSALIFEMIGLFLEISIVVSTIGPRSSAAVHRLKRQNGAIKETSCRPRSRSRGSHRCRSQYSAGDADSAPPDTSHAPSNAPRMLQANYRAPAARGNQAPTAIQRLGAGTNWRDAAAKLAVSPGRRAPPRTRVDRGARFIDRTRTRIQRMNFMMRSRDRASR